MNELIDIVKDLQFKRRGNFHSMRIGKSGKSLSFGFFNIPFKGNDFTRDTKNNWNTYIKLLNWGKINLADFEFNNIYINYNTKALKHIDKINVGKSYFVFFGNCIGGELLIYDKYDINKINHIVEKNNFYKFNGSKHYHETNPFNGDRFSIIFYKNKYFNHNDYIKYFNYYNNYYNNINQ